MWLIDMIDQDLARAVATVFQGFQREMESIGMQMANPEMEWEELERHLPQRMSVTEDEARRWIPILLDTFRVPMSEDEWVSALGISFELASSILEQYIEEARER